MVRSYGDAGSLPARMERELEKTVMQQGSYMLITPGMAVYGTDGHLGTVTEVVADAGVDVFRGIVVSHGILAHKAFVHGDAVISVIGERVELSLSKAEFDQLPPPQTPTPIAPTQIV